MDVAGQTTSLKVNWKLCPGFDPILLTKNTAEVLDQNLATMHQKM